MPFFFSIIPLFAAPLLMLLPNKPESVELLLSRYWLLILLWSSWQLLRSQVPGLIARKTATEQKSMTALPLLLSGVACITALIFLTLLRMRIPEYLFVALLAWLMLGSLRDLAQRKAWSLANRLAGLGEYTLLGFISCWIAQDAIHWQAGLLALAIAASIAATDFAKTIFEFAERPCSSKTARIKRANSLRPMLREYIFYLLLGPVIVAALCYLHQLPGQYLLCLLTLVFSRPLLVALKSSEESLALPARFIDQSYGTSTLFFVILLIAGLLPL